MTWNTGNNCCSYSFQWYFKLGFKLNIIFCTKYWQPATESRDITIKKMKPINAMFFGFIRGHYSEQNSVFPYSKPGFDQR